MKREQKKSRALKVSIVFSLTLALTIGVFGECNTACAAELFKSSLVYPLVGTRVSSKYGSRIHPVLKKKRHHSGIDLAAPEHAQIRAIHSGTVIYADPHGSYGNLIVIEHESGLTSHYGHCREITVETGTQVNTGELIGTVGSTGRVTGPHLHFEVRKNGKPLDPYKLFPEIALKGKG